MTQEQANDIRAREETLRAFLGDRHSYMPDEVAHLNPPTNEERSALEIFELHRDKPVQFTAYVPWGKGQAKHFGGGSKPVYSRDVATWMGDKVATICDYGPWHRNNFGARWRQVRVKPVFCNWYYTGREYDSRQCVNFRRMKAAF